MEDYIQIHLKEINSSGSQHGPMVSFYDGDEEPSDTYKNREFLLHQKTG
jgi:hypothetical protein